MPPKRPASSPASGEEPKSQKKVMTLHEKIELLDIVKEGKSYAAVGRHYGVNESTVRYIRKNDKAIKSSLCIECILRTKIKTLCLSSGCIILRPGLRRSRHPTGFISAPSLKWKNTSVRKGTEFRVLLLMDNAGGHPGGFVSRRSADRVAPSQHHITPPAYGSRGDSCI
ncbi:HTH psq-type domain-containing protein [Nephila pilipes]|uniref:HTH psq-type domain-containing protein n=1 Tax=Nephila pilipes TaxID=299642 RepID=A0A8X6Q7H0_NEPPI|nr:HTH psq-type domain-containing protein [Nephila pilipes]